MMGERVHLQVKQLYLFSILGIQTDFLCTKSLATRGKSLKITGLV